MISSKIAPPSGCEHYRSQAEMPAELNARLRQCAYEHGDTYAAYLVTEQDREYFWGADFRGVVGFRRRGRYITVADGLLAAPDDREQLLAQFLKFSNANRWHVSFMNVPRNEINLFRNQKCQVTKCGEEPLVRLQATKFQGKDWQWVRRQENFCKRAGVEFREVIQHRADLAGYLETVAPQLDEISRDHVAKTLHRRELKFFVSQFDATDLRERRLFVAEEKGRIIAFIVCNPGLAGDMWAVEVYRRRQDAIRGVVPSLITHAMRVMQAEGVNFFSLSLAPFVRCTPVTGDSAIFRVVANFWWRFLNPIYDVHGLFHFKSRFRPHYREMYLAANPPITVRSLWSIAMTWELFKFNPLRLAGRIRERRGAERRSLVVPDRGSERLLRDLRAKPRPAVPARVGGPSPTAQFLAAAAAVDSTQASELLAHENVSA